MPLFCCLCIFDVHFLNPIACRGGGESWTSHGMPLPSFVLHPKASDKKHSGPQIFHWQLFLPHKNQGLLPLKTWRKTSDMRRLLIPAPMHTLHAQFFAVQPFFPLLPTHF